MAIAVLLSGEHPTLPAAELRALLDVHAPDAIVRLVPAEVGPLAVVQPAGPGAPELQGVLRAASRMALAHAWGHWWGMAPDSQDGLTALEAIVHRRSDGQHSAAVATERRGTVHVSSTQETERRLGAVLKQRGHPIRLRNPDRTFFAWFVGGEIHVGELVGTVDRSAFEGRDSDTRAHFSPVSMHPRKAAALLHLARVPPGGRVLDPFCGTGTLALEAAIEGYQAWASDLDPAMVQGTLQTLTDAMRNPLDATVFVADIGEVPALTGHASMDGIVTDLPYGRASGSDGEALAGLYQRALRTFAEVLAPGRLAVIGCADPQLLGDVSRFALAIQEAHTERTHRSLTRHFIVVKRTTAVGATG